MNGRLLLLLAFLASAAACSGPDIDLGHGIAARTTPDEGRPAGGAAIDAHDATVGESDAATDRASAIVIRAADLPYTSATTSGPTSGSTVTSGSGSASTAGGTAIDPDLRFIFVGSGPPTCGNPAAGPACSYFRVAIRIPSTFFTPGLYYLADNSIVGTHTLREPAREDGTCLGDGGDFTDGTLEILDIGGGVAHLRLANTAQLGFDADGTYAAMVCP